MSRSPRARTRDRLRTLLGATAGGTAAVKLCYCVVDMLSPPPDCSDFSVGQWSDLNGSVVAHRDTDEIVLRVDGPSRGLSISGNVVVDGGDLVEVKFVPANRTTDLRVFLTPHTGVTTITVTGTVSCHGEDTQPWKATLTLPDPADTGDSGDTGDDAIVVVME